MWDFVFAEQIFAFKKLKKYSAIMSNLKKELYYLFIFILKFNSFFFFFFNSCPVQKVNIFRWAASKDFFFLLGTPNWKIIFALTLLFGITVSFTLEPETFGESRTLWTWQMDDYNSVSDARKKNDKHQPFLPQWTQMVKTKLVFTTANNQWKEEKERGVEKR